MKKRTKRKVIKTFEEWAADASLKDQLKLLLFFIETYNGADLKADLDAYVAGEYDE